MMIEEPSLKWIFFSVYFFFFKDVSCTHAAGTGAGTGAAQTGNSELDEEAKEAIKTAKDKVTARIAMLASAPLALATSDTGAAKEDAPKTGPNQIGCSKIPLIRLMYSQLRSLELF